MMRVSRAIAVLAVAAVGVLGLTTTSGASEPSDSDSDGRAIYVACADGWGGVAPPAGAQLQVGGCIPLADALAAAVSNGIPDDLILLRPGYYCPVDLPNTYGRLYLQGIPLDAVSDESGTAVRTHSDVENVVFARYADDGCDPIGDNAIIRSAVSTQFVLLQNLSVDGANTGVTTPDLSQAAGYGIKLGTEASYVRDVVVKGAGIGMKIDGGSVSHSAFVKNLYEGLETGGQRSTWIQDTLIAETTGGPSLGNGVGLLDGAISGNAQYADTLVNVTLTGNSIGLGRLPSVSNAYQNVRNTLIVGNGSDCDYGNAGMAGYSNANAVGSGCYGLSATTGSSVVDASVLNPVDYTSDLEPVAAPLWVYPTGVGDAANCSSTDQRERARTTCYIGAASPNEASPGPTPPVSTWIDIPSEVDLTPVDDQDSGVRTLTFSNKSGGYVTFRDVSVTAGFAIVRDDCSFGFVVRAWTNAGGAAAQPYCTIALQATGAGELHGTLQATTNHGGFTVPLVALETLTSGTPTISGTVKVGSTVTAQPGTWTAGTAFAYQWKRAGTAIAGATESTYTPVAADRGKQLTVTVTGSKTGYASASATSAAAKVGYGTLKTAKPTISGTARVGKTLTAKPGTWQAGSADVALTYQWYAGGTKIAAATKSTLKLKTAQQGKRITVKVTGAAPGYATVSKTSKATAKVAKQ